MAPWRLSIAFTLLLATCGASGPTVVLETRGGPVEVAVEIANDDASRTRGLMYRTTLAEGRGMLFVFPTNEVHDFWMKNTLIPLDLLWISDDHRILGIHASTTPLSMATIGVGTPSRYVLEVPGGFAARRGIETGDGVELRGVPAG